ncbi:flagellar basal-body MS-ring/collar protein FliF [Limnohabitans sp. 2KL-51]|uniref:flagellar basal-body MS-ring/collar protein FliF n=1 Tax=Limnohabitans sp. 2KL-51 TaxID=1977911 RepID=UPI000D3C8C67|nr:flagellar basal-body MS-ring/collar protein FliF [Limnohabitans sp. 2KL-51]PUE51636.1 flagellar M-ring protein FliF [Limnohabitans sp. 2KL-51]
MATATATMNNGMMTVPGNAGAVSAPPALAPNGSMALTSQGADAPGTGLSTWQTLGISDNFNKMINQPSVRRVLPLIVMLAVMVLFGLTYAWMSTTPYRPVMPGLQEADQQAAFESLKTSDFKPKIDPATGQLTVPSDRFHEARIFLAAQGLPKAGATGLDGLKDQSSMTTSQFMEQVKVNAAMEQELARSIMQIGSVQSARVHLATPKQSVFVRDRTPPKASVVLAPYPGRAVSASQVQAIVHLVSSSVPYLTPDHVTVVDNVGKLMTESATEQKLGLTSAQEQHKQQMEEVLRNRIMQILTPMVGEANVRSQVNLSLDFTQTESTTEDFDNRDKGPRTRSEVLAEDRAAVRAAEGIPGALANTPPPTPTTTTSTQVDPTKGQSESNNTLSSRSTRNFELDRTVRHVRSASGGIRKVSVAVIVNERPAPPPANGAAAEPNAPKSIPFTPQEIEQMQQVVRGVVGFDQARGDNVSVVPARFEAPAPLETIPWYIENKVQSALTSALIAISFIVFMLIVVRPIMRSITMAKAMAEEEKAKAAAMADGELSAEDMRMIQIGEGESLEEIKAKLKPKKSSISIDMLDTANTYDDKVALIRMLVAEDSGRVANVLKGMIKVS